MQSGEDLGEVGGKAVDSVGTHRGAGRTAVATVVVGDDSNGVTPPTLQLSDLGCPARLCQAKTVQQKDGMVASAGRAVVADRQPYTITRGNRSLDTAVPPRVQSPPARRATETAARCPTTSSDGTRELPSSDLAERTLGTPCRCRCRDGSRYLEGRVATHSQMRSWHGRIPCGPTCVARSDSLCRSRPSFDPVQTANGDENRVEPGPKAESGCVRGTPRGARCRAPPRACTSIGCQQLKST